jgi:branched-chain amino acid aminotransferase
MNDTQIFINNKLYLKDGFQMPDESVAVYEVLKVVGGIPLFYEDHIKRLNNSVKIAHIENFIFSELSFIEQIKILCKANNTYFGNVEFRISKLADNTIQSFIGFIPSYYPQPVNYLEGVKLSLFAAERENPNAKVKNTKTRLNANKFINDNQVFEVLLVNDEDFITEGSRSNVFFIQGNTVYSAPLKYILPGIGNFTHKTN